MLKNVVYDVLNGERQTGQNLNSMSIVLKYVCKYVDIGIDWNNIP